MRALNRKSRRRLTTILAAVAVGATAFIFAGCPGDENGQTASTKVQQSNYDMLVKKQPPHTMKYSPSRETINDWIDEWGQEPGKLAYVYIRNGAGDVIGYYVFVGPPLTNCAALTPTYKIYTSSNGNVMTPAPGMDGVHYSGGQCELYYGTDAVTKTTIAFTVGNAQSMTYFGQPLPIDAPPLGVATIDKVK